VFQLALLLIAYQVRVSIVISWKTSSVFLAFPYSNLLSRRLKEKPSQKNVFLRRLLYHHSSALSKTFSRFFRSFTANRHLMFAPEITTARRNADPAPARASSVVRRVSSQALG